MIYAGNYGDELRVDVGRSLTGAVSMELIITKPSGTVLTKTATQYGSTTKITYTTIEGDTDEAGTYLLNARVQWTGAKLTGDTVYLEVEALGAVSQAQVIEALPAYTFIDSVQSADEYNNTENTTADILYPQFAPMLKRAKGELANDLVTLDNLVLSKDDELAALCFLIAKYIMERNPAAFASNISTSGGGSVSHGSYGEGRMDKTDPERSYENILSKAQAGELGSDSLLTVDEEMTVHDDETNFQSVREGSYTPED